MPAAASGGGSGGFRASSGYGATRSPSRDRPGRAPRNDDRPWRTSGGSGGYARQQTPLPTSPPYTAFMGGLKYEVNEDDLKAGLQDSGIPVKSARIVRDRQTGDSKGFGYVEFDSVDALKQALELHGKRFLESVVKVDVAEPPRNSSGEDRERRPMMGKFAQDDSRDYSSWRRESPLAPQRTRAPSADRPPRRSVEDRPPRPSMGGESKFETVVAGPWRRAQGQAPPPTRPTRPMTSDSAVSSTNSTNPRGNSGEWKRTGPPWPSGPRRDRNPEQDKHAQESLNKIAAMRLGTK